MGTDLSLGEMKMCDAETSLQYVETWDSDVTLQGYRCNYWLRNSSSVYCKVRISSQIGLDTTIHLALKGKYLSLSHGEMTAQTGDVMKIDYVLKRFCEMHIKCTMNIFRKVYRPPRVLFIVVFFISFTPSFLPPPSTSPSLGFLLGPLQFCDPWLPLL